MQQKLGEIAEGDGLLLGDAALGHEEKNLGESAVDIGGGSEVGTERYEFGRFERSVFSTGFAWFGGMVEAKRRSLVAAAASVGVGELTTGAVEVIGGILAGSSVLRNVDGARRRRNGVGEWFFYGSHKLCYHISIHRSIV